MTAPVLPSILPMLGSVPHVMSYDEWQQAQYAPHRVGSDPTEPQGPGRILTYDEFDAARRSGSVDTMQFPALPRLPKLAGDATTRSNPLAPKSKGKELAPFDISDPTTYANPILRQVVNPMLEHPLASAGVLAAPFAVPALVGGVVGAGIGGSMVYHIASYGWQKAAELTLSPEERKLAEADPERISGESAAVQAALLGLAPLIHAGVKAVRGSAATPPVDAVQATEVPLTPEAVRTAAAERVTKASEPAQYFETPQGADVLGRTAARHGLPEDASPYPPNSQLDVAWKNGHGETIPIPEAFGGGEMPVTKAVRQALAEKAARGEYDPFGDARSIDRFNAAVRTSGEATAEPPPPITPGPDEKVPVRATAATTQTTIPALESRAANAEIPALPRSVSQPNLYRRLSDDALEAEYRALTSKQAVEQEQAQPPLWTPEREAEAVEQIENRRRPDGSLSPADKRRLDALQLQQGEGYNTPRHTFESQAAEQRVNARAKYITAAEQALAGRGIDPTDVLQRAPTAAREPVQGTGELRTRGLSLGVEQKAIEHKLTDYLGDIPEYRQLSMADQAARATKLIADDPALAREVALGNAPPPADLLPESVFVAVENKAIAEGDVGTLRELASGRLTAQVTEKAQSLRTLAERDPESPVAAMQKVAEARAKGVAKPEAEIAKTVDEMKTHLADATKIEPSAFQKFIDDLRC